MSAGLYTCTLEAKLVFRAAKVLHPLVLITTTGESSPGGVWLALHRLNSTAAVIQVCGRRASGCRRKRLAARKLGWYPGTPEWRWSHRILRVPSTILAFQP
ncbi:hypothetical protein Bbelb_269130 [Branchiostoma belcheri]|nr:hypothetical protein Bbelb_269130 [Branchiostoma belcheri]